jgi:hypothetical protein
VIRRRSSSVDAAPPDLMDTQRWPQCPRFDGEIQACVCWFAKAQREWIETGNSWPGNDLTDLLTTLGIHECNAPFDQAVI